MLVSELLKKTNQSGLNDSKQKEEALNANALLKRFNDLSLQIQMTMKTRNTKLEQKLARIEKELRNLTADDEFVKLNCQIDQLQASVDELIEEDEKLSTIVRGRVKNAHENFQAHVDDLKAESRDILSGFTKESEKQLFGVDITLKKQQKAFHEKLYAYDGQLTEAVDALQRDIEQVYEERESQAKAMSDEIYGYLEALEEDLTYEKSLREQTEDKLRELIDGINTDFENKIQIEKKERETSNNSLLHLLEQACTKLEKNFMAY